MTLVVDVLGHHLVVGFDNADVERYARRMLADMGPTGDGLTDDEVPILGSDVITLLPSLVGTINLAVIRLGAGRLMPHAGAVARADGSVALICGASGAGKSTLTAALLQRGCAYLTDETAVLEPASLEILPFRKPLSLKRGSHDCFAEARPEWASDADVWLVPASTFGQTPVPSLPMEPRVLVFPRFSADADRVEVERVSAGEAAYLVGTQSSRLRDVDGGPLATLARLVRRVPAYRLRYADSKLAADEVQRLWPA